MYDVEISRNFQNSLILSCISYSQAPQLKDQCKLSCLLQYPHRRSWPWFSTLTEVIETDIFARIGGEEFVMSRPGPRDDFGNFDRRVRTEDREIQTEDRGIQTEDRRVWVHPLQKKNKGVSWSKHKE